MKYIKVQYLPVKRSEVEVWSYIKWKYSNEVPLKYLFTLSISKFYWVTLFEQMYFPPSCKTVLTEEKYSGNSDNTKHSHADGDWW